MTKVIVTTPQELEQMLARIIKENGLIAGSRQPRSSKEILDINEASKFLGIPKNTLYGYTSKRLIPHKKVGRSLKFLKSDLMTWLEESKRKTVNEIKNS